MLWSFRHFDVGGSAQPRRLTIDCVDETSLHVDWFAYEANVAGGTNAGRQPLR